MLKLKTSLFLMLDLEIYMKIQAEKQGKTTESLFAAELCIAI